MFGIEELTELKEDLEKAIEKARRAAVLWEMKRSEILALGLSEEQLTKIADIMDL